MLPAASARITRTVPRGQGRQSRNVIPSTTRNCSLTRQPCRRELFNYNETPSSRCSNSPDPYRGLGPLAPARHVPRSCACTPEMGLVPAGPAVSALAQRCREADRPACGGSVLLRALTVGCVRACRRGWPPAIALLCCPVPASRAPLDFRIRKSEAPASSLPMSAAVVSAFRGAGSSVMRATGEERFAHGSAGFSWPGAAAAGV
jgi:hypothetical protein